jgi:NADP-dependent 3-hydroxy acid dehydrogenase YdfG
MNIVITGASSGIGYATALRFSAEPGNLIFAMARSGDKLEELSASAGKSRIIPVVQDITDFTFVRLEEVLLQEGVSHIDILIHNAGYLSQQAI